MPVAKSADQWFDEYGESHQNKVNKAIHWVAVPTIFLTVVGLLWSIPVPDLFSSIPFMNWASISMVVAVVFYLRLSISIAIGMLVIAVGCLAITSWYEGLGHWAVWQMSLVVFVVMWVFQFIGHKIEGKKPSFFKDIQFLLIGPAWLLHFLYKKAGIRY